MKLVNSREMSELDKRATDEIGIPSIVLMENAGVQASYAIERHFAPLSGKKICIVCGKGNNGGDGMVVARHFFNRGYNVVAILLGNRKELKTDAKINAEIALCMGLTVYEIPSGEPLDSFEQLINQSDLLIDAIFGTGLKSVLPDFYQQIIRFMNDSNKPIVSLDIPTGLCASTGKGLGVYIHAQLTITFALPKIGLICSHHRHHVGKLEIVDIGIPHSLSNNPELKVELLEGKLLKEYFKKRKHGAHKGDFGHALVVAGSPGKTGAGVMAAQAMLRSGAGLATLAVPQSLHSIVETKTTEVMTIGLPETQEHTLSREAFEPIMKLTEKMRVLAIGPGLGTHPETALLIKDLIANTNCPVVLDADGINNLSLADLHESKSLLIITPHAGEMAHLLNISSKEVQENRLEAVQKTAMACQTYVVLKGNATLISDPEGNIFVNPTGNPGMATAGAGDVLTGVIAGLLAQGIDPVAACSAGVYLHGLAGDLACQKMGEYGLIATDLIEQIPNAILHITGE